MVKEKVLKNKVIVTLKIILLLIVIIFISSIIYHQSYEKGYLEGSRWSKEEYSKSLQLLEMRLDAQQRIMDDLLSRNITCVATSYEDGNISVIESNYVVSK